MEDLAAGKPPEIAGALSEKLGQPEAVLDHLDDGADLIVGLANGEPVTVVDALEASAGRLSRLQHPRADQEANRYRPPEVQRWALAQSQRVGIHVKFAKRLEPLCERISARFSLRASLVSFLCAPPAWLKITRPERIAFTY